LLGSHGQLPETSEEMISLLEHLANGGTQPRKGMINFFDDNGIEWTGPIEGLVIIYTCAFCKLNFKTENGLIEHVKICSQNKNKP
jgi:hypothetical protein